MNRVVKTLTIISTYFIPVTFIVGIYGMNFRYMPELNLHGMGISFVWILMILVVIGLTVYFRKEEMVLMPTILQTLLEHWSSCEFNKI